MFRLYRTYKFTNSKQTCIVKHVSTNRGCNPSQKGNHHGRLHL
nr:MAG TPA_asm: hypothetical protein [Caudoviricetes sp.]